MKTKSKLILKIISGGQTGVDRAALDAAMICDLPVGGWCPKNRIAEDGVLDSRYPLQETESSDYAQRTRFNVRDADGTLIIASDYLSGGTALTKKFALQLERPLLLINPENPGALITIRDWLCVHEIKTLNVAGPRGRNRPEIYKNTFDLLCRFFSESICDAIDV